MNWQVFFNGNSIGFTLIQSFPWLKIAFCHFLDQSIHILFGKSSLVRHHLDLRQCGRIDSWHTQNSIFIYCKFYLEFRHSTWSRCDAHEIKAAKKIVVFSHRSLPFEDLNAKNREEKTRENRFFFYFSQVDTQPVHPFVTISEQNFTNV